VTPIRIEMLGTLRFTFGRNVLTSVNTKRLQSLLAFLVLHGDAAQSRERLAFLLWPESGESQARTNLRQLLHHLRRALPVECSLLGIDNQTVCWPVDSSCRIDVVEFEAAVVQAANAEKQGDLTTAREALEEAARLYQDDLLPDLYDDWLQPKRTQLRQQFAEVLSRLAALLEMAGDYPAAIRYATRLVALDSLREAYYYTLMRLHARNQDRSSTLRVYHQCMRNLQRELGVSPGKAIQDLFMQTLKSEDLPSAPAELLALAMAKPLPMVGRKVELDRLLGCWRLVTQGDAHFALILGEPGIGKSRLAEELYDSCSRYPSSTAARARCYFAQGQLAYGPVAEWLRTEPLRLARAQLPKPQLAELARVLPEILVENPEIPPPQPLTENWQRLHLYEALNAAFRNSPKPLLLLIDDLQWCDHDPFEWLHSLFRAGSANRILLLGTVRPEETGRDHPLASLVHELRQSGQLSEFPIVPLTVEETGVLAAQIVTRECDPAFLSKLYQTTKGNPLFVVECVRASVNHQASGTSPPPRVQAVIAARLAQLSPSAYELAGLAATVGRPFAIDLLAKATDWDEDSLSHALEELWQRRIIDGAGTYDYTHDLLREVAYAELSPVRRRSLHQRVARALEELYTPDLEPISGWLAAHYEAAGRAEEAIRYYRAAASVAKQRFADAEAADLIQRALRLRRDFPELLVTLGPSLVTTHGYSMPEVGEVYERGLLLSKRSGDRKHLFSLLSGAWLFHIVRGHLEESRRLAQECVDDACHGGVSALEMAGHFLLGSSLFHLGQLEASRQQIDQAVQSYSTLAHPALALFAGPNVGVFCHAYLSHLLWQLGHAGQAVANSEESIALAHDVSHPFGIAIALDYAAMLNVFRQETSLARTRAAEASAVCRKHGFAYYLAVAEILGGWAGALEGDTAAGLAQLRHGLDALKAMEAELRLPFYYGLLAEAYGRAGQVGEALANIASGFASRVTTLKCGRRPNCTGFTVTCYYRADIQSNLESATAARSNLPSTRARACLSLGPPLVCESCPRFDAAGTSPNADLVAVRTVSERLPSQSS
jgi:DNA-binding SARP family transcriptional activator/predicted ATPase